MTQTPSSEPRVVTNEEKNHTAAVLTNVARLLKAGLFFGQDAQLVHEAIMWCDKMVEQLAPEPEEDEDEGEDDECDEADEV